MNWAIAAQFFAAGLVVGAFVVLFFHARKCERDKTPTDEWYCHHEDCEFHIAAYTNNFNAARDTVNAYRKAHLNGSHDGV